MRLWLFSQHWLEYYLELELLQMRSTYLIQLLSNSRISILLILLANSTRTTTIYRRMPPVNACVLMKCLLKDTNQNGWRMKKLERSPQQNFELIRSKILSKLNEAKLDHI